MTASYKTSTLSLVFLLSLVSVFSLLFIAILTAIFAPEAYKLASEDKTLVLVILVAYIGFVSNIVGAYLGSRLPNKVSENEPTTIQDQTAG